MKLKNILFRLVAKASIIGLMVSLLAIGFSAAQFFDLEISSGNSINAGILDLTVRSGQNNFVSGSADVLAMKPGQSAARDIYVAKTAGSMNLKHQAGYDFVSGDENFCGQLWLKVWYNHYQCDPSAGYACRDMRLKYNGLLTSFNEFTNFDFLIFHPDDLLDTDPANGTEQWFFYEIIMPSGLQPIYQNKTCEFNFVYDAWQEESDNSWGFTDGEILGGSKIISADWLGPTVSIESLIPNPTNVDPELTARAQDGYSPITAIYYDLYNSSSVLLRDDQPLTAQDGAYDSLDEFGQTVIDINGLADGVYTLYVFSQDSAGNIAQTPAYTLTVDQALPITGFYTSNSPKRQIKNDILNGDFEASPDGLEHWQVFGNAEVLAEDILDETTIVKASDIPNSAEENHMVKIMPADAPDEDLLYYSYISQPIPNSAKTISFWYNFATYDSVGFDNPGFSVFINEKQVFQVWAEDINQTGGELALSGWNKFYYDLNSFAMDEHPVLTLVFYSGDRYDSALNSWIYLDKISTSDVYVNDQTKLYLQTPAGLTSAKTYYRLGPCLKEFNEENYLLYSGEFSLSAPTAENRFCYFSRDDAGNLETPNEVTLIYDNIAPDSITDLLVIPTADGEFKLDWTAVDPKDAITGNKTAAYYLLKYMEDDPDDENDTIIEANFNEAVDYWTEAPRPDGEPDHADIIGLSPEKAYHFAIKACDAASNCSALSNVEKSKVSYSGGTATTPEVIINEIMWMGSELSSYDEWVELYNTTDDPINLQEWQIIKKRTDGIEQCMFTFPEYWLGAKDYVVVSEYDKDHSAINIECPGPKCLIVGEGHTNNRDFSLVNDRLQIRLYDGWWIQPEIKLIDMADDGAGKPAAGSYDKDSGIYQSMERNAVPGNGADPNNWHTCDDPASAVYWDSGLTGQHWGTPGALNLSQPGPSASLTPTLDIIEQQTSGQTDYNKTDIIGDEEASSSAQNNDTQEPSPTPDVSPSPSPSPSPDPSPSPEPKEENE